MRARGSKVIVVIVSYSTPHYNFLALCGAGLGGVIAVIVVLSLIAVVVSMVIERSNRSNRSNFLASEVIQDGNE